MNDFSRFTLSAIVCLSVFALAGQSAGSDKTMSFRQHQIERNYAARMSQLYARAEREANKLNVTNRLLWLEFITGDETPYSDSFSLYTVGGGSGSLRFSTSTDIGGEVVTSSVLVASSSENYDTKLTTLTRPQRYLQAHLADSYSLRQFAMFLLSDQSGIVLSDIADSRFQNRRLRNQARALLRIAERLHIEAGEIESIRNSALAALRLDEESANDGISAPVEQAQVQSQVIEPGTIVAVAVDGKSLCMIAGVEQILAQGDTIDQGFGEGIRVAKLEPGKVELQKGRRTWTQKVGESPSKNWQ